MVSSRFRETTGTSWDRRTVQVSANGGGFTQLVQLSGDSMLEWHQYTLDLTAYAGQTIQLRFFFDTRDGIGNNGRGWYVDDVLVYTTAVPYAFEPVEFDYLDISGSGTMLGSVSSCDDCGTIVPMGFSFPFFTGVLETHVGVSSNGYLGFGSDIRDYSNDNIPNTNDPDEYIAPFWDDLYTSGSSAPSSDVYYETLGAPGSRQFVAQYEDVDWCCSDNNGQLDFQVILNEADGSIVFQYLDMFSVNVGRGGGNSATIGIENAGGTDGLKYSYNSESVTDGMALKLVRTILDSDGDGLNDAFELAFGLNPNDPNDPPSVNDDVDGDGLSWLEEQAVSTNPLDFDTDDDEVGDGDELAAGTNPLVGDGPVTTVNFAAPGTAFGTAYFEFSIANFDGSTEGYVVYYGGQSGNTIEDYPADLEVDNPSARKGLIDQTWGMQGQPIVYFRVAPYRTINGRRYVGTPSNELSTYFSGAEAAKSGANTGDADASDGDSDSGGFCFIRSLGLGEAR